jgi:hypothetical protein
MKVLGIDFTSAPRHSKPITCLNCVFDDGLLHAQKLEEWTSFSGFEAALQFPGLWIAGVDFPFGQSRTFIENIGWPETWAKYVSHAGALTRKKFRTDLNDYRAGRSDGDKEHRRQTDIAAGSISPQKLYGVPVGLMFYEAAPRLLNAGVTIPYLNDGDPERIVVEAYPGILARKLIGRRSYKQDTRRKQTQDQQDARRVLLERIVSGALAESFGIRVQAGAELADDPSGDHLDALLCAIQAAWSWTRRNERYGAPASVDPLEGWIADPSLCGLSLAACSPIPR